MLTHQLSNAVKTPNNNISISNIKIINTHKIIGLILLSLLLCLKAFAEESAIISPVPTNNLENTLQMPAEPLPGSDAGVQHLSSVTNYTEELLLAEFEINNNQPLKALKIYQKIAQATHDPLIAKRATELSLEHSQDHETLKTVRIWADADPKSIKAQLLASLLVSQYESVENSEKYLENLFLIKDVSEEHQYAYYELLINHPYENNSLAKLGRILENFVKQPKFKNNSSINLALSMYYEKAGDGTKSLEYINKTLKINNKLQIAHIQKIRLLNIYKSTNTTLKYLEDTIALFPDNHELRKLYADILYDLEKWSEAKNQYQALISQKIHVEEATLQLAYIYINTDDLKAAKKYLIKLADSESYGDMAKYYLGILSMQLGNLEDAQKYFNQTTDGEYHIRSKIRLASMLKEKNRLNDAQKIIDQTILEYKAKEAEKYAKEIILSESETLYQQGLYTHALSILNFVKAHYPNDPDIFYSIGILANKLNNPKLFEENMNYVIAKNPTNCDALSALGWHYYKNDQNEKAHELLQKAYETDNFNSTKIGSRYAAVLWRLGQHEKADKIWQKYLELDPNNKALRDMIKETKNTN